MTTTLRNPFRPGSTSATIWETCDRLAFTMVFDPRGRAPTVEEVAASLPNISLGSVRSIHSHWVAAAHGRKAEVRRRRAALKAAGLLPSLYADASTGA